MAYADQQMSGNRLTALIIVALIHLVVGYMLVTGLAYSAVQQVIKHVTTVDVKDEKKPPPPPPPPKNLPPPPPIVAPPPPIQLSVAPPPVETVMKAPPVVQQVIVPVAVHTEAPVSKARGVANSPDRARWMAEINDSASPDLVREGKSGVVGVSVDVGPSGRPTGCSVSSPSGVAGLDKLACSGIMRFARYTPALDDAGNPTSGTRSERVRFDFSEEDQ